MKFLNFFVLSLLATGSVLGASDPADLKESDSPLSTSTPRPLTPPASASEPLAQGDGCGAANVSEAFAAELDTSAAVSAASGSEDSILNPSALGISGGDDPLTPPSYLSSTQDPSTALAFEVVSSAPADPAQSSAPVAASPAVDLEAMSAEQLDALIAAAQARRAAALAATVSAPVPAPASITAPVAEATTVTESTSAAADVTTAAPVPTTSPGGPADSSAAPTEASATVDAPPAVVPAPDIALASSPSAPPDPNAALMAMMIEMMARMDALEGRSAAAPAALATPPTVSPTAAAAAPTPAPTSTPVAPASTPIPAVSSSVGGFPGLPVGGEGERGGITKRWLPGGRGGRGPSPLHGKPPVTLAGVLGLYSSLSSPAPCPPSPVPVPVLRCTLAGPLVSLPAGALVYERGLWYWNSDEVTLLSSASKPPLSSASLQVGRNVYTALPFLSSVLTWVRGLPPSTEESLTSTTRFAIGGKSLAALVAVMGPGPFDVGATVGAMFSGSGEGVAESVGLALPTLLWVQGSQERGLPAVTVLGSIVPNTHLVSENPRVWYEQDPNGGKLIGWRIDNTMIGPVSVANLRQLWDALNGDPRFLSQ